VGTGAYPQFRQFHIRWRNLGHVDPLDPTSDYDFGPDDCITPCLTTGKHIYSSQNTTYAKTDGRAFRPGTTYDWACFGGVDFVNVRGQCSGP
jgi:hypothetical protein